MRPFHLVLLFAGLAASGCSTTELRNQQLEKVAKDWSLVLRASQVIPVYPLSEDLQPGDVLLVDTPIEDQVTLYKAKGFLPLDQLVVRLYAGGLPYKKEFQNFYRNRYGIAESALPPAQWQFRDTNGAHSWSSAPRASFPSYQFSVRSGAGIDLAIPIQGVPFGLGLMNSGSATGSVTITDAYTYGLDTVSLQQAADAWAADHRPFLRQFQPHDGRTSYLRVVSRVYVTGGVSVTLHNDEAFGGEARGGADRPVELLGIKEGAPDENYANAIAAINRIAKDQLPGGKVKVATASSRSVTLQETFDRPLVLGYIGFDLPILRGGRLGPPISTLAQLEERKTNAAQAAGSIHRTAALAHLRAALAAIEGEEATRMRAELDRLAQILPASYPFGLYEFSAPGVLAPDPTVVVGAAVPREDFGSVLDYLGAAETTIATLREHMPSVADAAQRTRLQNELDAAQQSHDAIESQLSASPAVQQAIDFVFFPTER